MDLENKLLKSVEEGIVLDSYEFSQQNNIEHVDLIGRLKSLYGDKYLEIEQKETNFYELTKEAEGYVKNGSPEVQLLKVIVEKHGLTTPETKKYGVGFGKCMRNKWIKQEGDLWVSTTSLSEIQDELKDQLSILSAAQGSLDALPQKIVKDLKKRKLIKSVKITHYAFKKGENWALQRVKKQAALTKAMLEDGSWKTTTFRDTNWTSTGVNPNGGHLHPLMLVRSEYKKILIGMGFEEMPTSKWVESGFWNFDALFQPQQHPARDAHDTFFIKSPEKDELLDAPKEYIERVKNIHEKGGFGSIGYRYDWSLEEAKKNILRTHTTAVSTAMLYKLANQDGGFQPKKYFSIDRVFRNESLDATHLAEFHQIEGLVADYNLSLADLMGVIKQFFAGCGIHDIRFKPAYNPYTEPSMEIFGYHPDLKKWTEIGNSGMFRPEMLRPMGLPEGVRVIAWGLGLERPTMIKYRFSKIKELFGHKINIDANQKAPLPRVG
eukprot:maker-scaffold_1-snap-gene-11.33-mRNA-1 protein AED:0.10 eAED:0.10 QI:44/1/1/1/1/1/3/67/491